MGDFVAIMLAIIFSVTPKDVNRVQIWPYAGDTNQQTSKLSVTFRRTETGWCPDDGDTNQTRCVTISDGRWIDEHGQTQLDIRNNLKVTDGTNYVFKPTDWERPLEFSVAEGKEERLFEIRSGGKTIRVFKVKPLKSNKTLEPTADGAFILRSIDNITSTDSVTRRCAAVAQLGR